MNQFSLRLTGPEVDQIANVLAKQPWMEVHALLANIKQQIEQAQKVAPQPQAAGSPEGAT
jgi:hypothetical protein